MKELTYNKVREDIVKSKDIHSYIINSVGNARKKSMENTCYNVICGKSDYTNLYKESLKERQNIIFLNKFDTGLEGELTKHQSNPFEWVLNN